MEEGESVPLSDLNFAGGFSPTWESPSENANVTYLVADTFIEHLLCTRYWAMQCFFFFNIFIDYAITVVPFPPSLHSILRTPSLPHSPPIVHVHGSYL